MTEKNRNARKPLATTDLSRVEDLSADWTGVDEGLPVQPPPPTRRRLPLLKWCVSALFSLLILYATVAGEQMVRDLFERSQWLGWTAFTLALLAALFGLGFILREIRGLMRMAHIESVRQLAAEARTTNDTGKSRTLVHRLDTLYAAYPETAMGRKTLRAHTSEVMDGRDLVRLADTELLLPLDRRARAMILSSARRVSVVTAVSPRALVDVMFVLYENMRLIRAIAELYGGRPGAAALWRLAKRVVRHLAATGAIALGDSVLQQLIGHGMATRLSARLGEGVVNGMLTARIGLATMDLCRPIQFEAGDRPKIGTFLNDLIARADRKADKEVSNNDN